MQQAARAALAVGLMVGLAAPCVAFKMGRGNEYQMAEDLARQTSGVDRWVYQRMQTQRMSFGDPVHEDMTAASVELARQMTPEHRCGATNEQLEAFLRPVPSAALGNAVCCARTAKSLWCDKIDDAVRYGSFPDPNPPLITGVRWNDDPCHMTLRRDTTLGWVAWMLDAGYRKAANLNYASHYHDRQFLHAMASTGFGRPDSELEAAWLTIHKITTWAEFAFRVGEGSVDGAVPLNEVARHLEPHRTKAFNGAFGGHGRLPVGTFFAGVEAYSPAHVRQLAIGGLLHTVQDSFSASHVQRLNDEAPVLRERGAIVRFHSYRLQDASLHAAADVRFADALQATASDFHPVSLGARLIGCAAAGSAGASKWPEVKKIVGDWLRQSRPDRNLPASGGRFVRDPGLAP